MKSNRMDMIQNTVGLPIRWKVFWILCFWCTSYAAQLPAQILPPDLICVTGDTLFWNPPVQTCGPTTGYVVFTSTQPEGPFDQLATLNDPTATFYVHSNALATVRYYYVESTADCPGAAAFASDTLDNLLPQIGPIQEASVAGTSVVINWSASPSPEVIGYVIYRDINSVPVPIDTIFDALTYTDPLVGADQMTQTYNVLALDACGNTSLFQNAHRTMLLSTEAVDECAGTMQITWTAYVGYGATLSGYDIFGSEDGGPLELIDNVAPDVLTYTLTELRDLTNYQIVVQANRTNSETARSNAIDFVVDIVQRNCDLFLDFVSVASDASRLRWSNDVTAEATGTQVLIFNESTGAETEVDLGQAAPLSAEVEYVDMNVGLPTEGRVFYTVFNSYPCGDPQRSNMFSTAFLTAGAIIENNVTLTWLPPVVEGGRVVQYELFRREADGSETSLSILDPSTTNFVDQPTFFASEQREVCYILQTTVELVTPTGMELVRMVRSNVACTERQIDLFVPNAFAPTGRNKIFRPVLNFGVPQRYALRIFDRYGQALFQSNLPEEGWRGLDANGRIMPNGVYVYEIVIEREGGQRTEQRGTVLLIR